jgi:hypothetical protein
MSTTYSQEITCSACSAISVVEIADSVSAERAPWMRAAILDRTFHVFACSGCGDPLRVEKELLYLDVPRRQWIGMFPPPDMARHEECSALVTATFREAFVERAAPVVQGWGADMKVRLVFGLEQLREKIICWERGLDDGIVELLKIEILVGREDLRPYQPVTLILDDSDGDNLGFMIAYAEPPRESAPRLVFVPMEAYRQVEAALPELRDAHARMLEGPFVNLLIFRPMEANTSDKRASVDRRIWRDSRP